MTPCTAAHLFYGLNRFSVDLDFDLLEKTNEDFVFEGVRTILEKYGVVKDRSCPAWAKAHLREDTIFLLKLLLEGKR